MKTTCQIADVECYDLTGMIDTTGFMLASQLQRNIKKRNPAKAGHLIHFQVSECTLFLPALRLNSDLEHTITLVGEQVVSRDDVF